MEQKTNALKVSSKVISVIMKIGYIVMLVMTCISASSFIFMAVTGGKTSVKIAGGHKIAITDELSKTPKELAVIFSEFLIMGVFLFVIFLLTQRMFQNINLTGNPFTEKHVKTVRVIGILVVIMNIVVPVVADIGEFVAGTDLLKGYTEAPGIVVGIIIFCLSYIIDYGCALKEEYDKSKKS